MSIFVFPRPHLQTLCIVYDSEVTVICCGKSVLHVVGLKPVRDAKRFRSDPTIHDNTIRV